MFIAAMLLSIAVQASVPSEPGCGAEAARGTDFMAMLGSAPQQSKAETSTSDTKSAPSNVADAVQSADAAHDAKGALDRREQASNASGDGGGTCGVPSQPA